MEQNPQFKPSDNFTEKALTEMTGTYLRNIV